MAKNTGRENLLEEVGRIDAEKPNANRRAEKRRVVGELNKGYKKGGRVGFKHGKWVRDPNPHVDVDKYVDKQTGKEDDDKPGSRHRVEGSEMKFKKTENRRKAGPSATRPKGGWTS
jgi:hypothetical protein